MAPLRILLLEDSEDDTALIKESLASDHLVDQLHRVQTREEFVDALDDGRVDLILADYKLPTFDGISALKIALSSRPDVPFIFVSGTLGEEIAIETLKIGATDYVLKSGLSKLTSAVQRALREAKERAARKRAEETLQEQANLLNLTRDAIFVHDMSGNITYWNHSAEILYGWTSHEAMKSTVSRLLQTSSPPLSESITSQLLKNGHWEGELVRTKKNRTQITVASRWSLQRDAHGVPISVLETNNDVTDRKRAEAEHERLRQLEADIVRMSRISMMGELAASLAHEINQPISAAVTNAGACKQWLLHEPPDVAAARDAASAMVASARHAASIIDRIRSLYRRGSPERELVQLNEIIKEMTELLGNTATRNSVVIRRETDPALPLSIADRVQLQQVLLNLMLNGIEAMKDKGGELTVMTERTDTNSLLVAVRDSGIGLPPDDADRIFDAFYTTKPHGTGMGLSISRRIIDSHGGRLWAMANPGQGATFYFTLPDQSTGK